MRNRESKYAAPWKEAFLLGINMVGGKVWNLSRLNRYGFKIPYGLVLTTAAFQEFIDYNQLSELFKLTSRQIHSENLGEADNTLYRLRKQIIRATMPPIVVDAIQERLAVEGLDNKASSCR